MSCESVNYSRFLSGYFYALQAMETRHAVPIDTESITNQKRLLSLKWNTQDEMHEIGYESVMYRVSI